MARMRLVTQTLSRPAGEGARLLVQGLLTEADQAVERLETGHDGDSLHDFRVALRRLRSALKAFRPWLDGRVKRRHERRLKRLANATNQARDAEVQRAWLESQRSALSLERHLAGYEWMVERIGTLARRGPQRDRVVRRYRRLSGTLGARLARSGDAHSTPTLGAVLGVLLRRQVLALREALDAAEVPGDDGYLHQARIEGKRLRYLLEPLKGFAGADASEPVRRLKVLQDVLGELHDSSLLAEELRRALRKARRRRGSARRGAVRRQRSTRHPGERACPASAREPMAGLVALSRRLRQRRDALRGALAREGSPGELDALVDAVTGVARALEALCAPQGSAFSSAP